MSNNLKLTPETSKALIYLGIGIVVIIVLATVAKKVFGGIGSMLEGFGIKDNPEEKEIKETIKAAEKKAITEPQSSPWSPQMFKLAPSGTKLVTAATADKAARQIKDSSGYILPDKPEQALAAFKLMPNQAAVSFLVQRFEVLYSVDLLSWLTESFNDTPTQMKVYSQILTYVDKLKKY